VVAIVDGDTLTLLVDGREQVKVRLAEIDTPEKRQPYGNKAPKALAALAFNKDASVILAGAGSLRPASRSRLRGRTRCERRGSASGARVGLPTVHLG
jgi:endonuclease YncB( thermonuclease family)